MTDVLSFSASTARFALPFLFAAQAQKEIFHNEALSRIDALLHPAVLGEANTPPSDPEEGACWLVGEAPDGEWHGHAGAIAFREAGQWLFAQPRRGTRIFDVADGQFAVFADEWQKPAAVQEPSGGLNVDSEARAAIGALLLALRAAGILPSA